MQAEPQASATASGALKVEHPQSLRVAEVVDALGLDPRAGLTFTEAQRRLEATGRNELPTARPTPLLVRFLQQLREPMALLLLAAAAISAFALGEVVDGIAIATIVVINAVIALVQEGRAAAALVALRNLEVPSARVHRDGRDRLVPASELVPGDLVVLEAGDRAPADLRLIAANGLEVDESVLTGESLPVTKAPDRLAQRNAPLGEQPAMVFSGTFIARGTGRGVVTATGLRTAIGEIARDVSEKPRATPLQTDLALVTRRLGAVCVVIAVIVLGLILARQGVSTESVEQAFLAAIALAVAAIPEGLATVTVVGLALGVRRMAERGAIVRRLPAVETLGAATILATDKTGTLTENRIELEAFAPPDGDFMPGEQDGRLPEDVERIAVLCNDGDLDPPVGDPTDVALLEAFGVERVDALRAAWQRRAVIPFDSERKRETTLHSGPHGALELQVKGAPEHVLPRCTGTPEWRRRVLARNEHAAARGTRVLALARRALTTLPDDLDEAETDLEFAGLVGLRDPIRAAAAASVAEARSAGISLLMATGDHPGTATAIAEDVGLAPPPVRAVTGRDLRVDGFGEDPAVIAVYARVDPDQKLELVRLLQERGHVVGMTGDGVNDAPALRRADIGIALGRRGSDVAREAADMVITDDDLATIVAAVREGRGVYDNIRKVVDYLVTGNLGEVLVVVVALLSVPALGVPLFPLQLLWINLVTDGMPAVALGVDPSDPNLMRRPPRPRNQRLLGWDRLRVLLVRGTLIAAATLAALLLARYRFEAPWEEARAVMFTTLVVAGLLYAFVVRKGSGGLFANRWLLLAVAGGFLAQILIVYWPPAQDLFSTVPLSLRDWALVLVAGAAPSVLLYFMPQQGFVPGRADPGSTP